MTLEQVKAYVVGVLKGWFPNKATLNKLSESDEGNLLYDGQEIKGGGTVIAGDNISYGANVVKIAEIADIRKTQDSSKGGYFVIPLSQPFTDFDVLRISMYYASMNYVREVPVSAIQNIGNNDALVVINNIESNNQSMFKICRNGSVPLNPDELLVVTINPTAVVGPVIIEGIKWQESKVGRKLYSLFDVLEYNEDNANPYVYAGNQIDTPDGALAQLFDIQSIEEYDAVLTCLECDMPKQNWNGSHFGWQEIPTDFIKKNYGRGICTFSTDSSLITVGWQDATRMGIHTAINSGTQYRVRLVYGIKYETVTESETIDINAAITETVEELNS